jgi:uncharacterized membrane protein YjdF
MQIKRFMLLLVVAALAAAVFVLNSIALEHHLYWTYWWYDIMMHFLGGCAVGGMTAWIVLRLKSSLSWRHVAIATFVSIMVIGIGWEVFEYMTGQFIGQEDVVVDTVMDLVLDTLGALVTAFMVYAITREHNAIRSV